MMLDDTAVYHERPVYRTRVSYDVQRWVRMELPETRWAALQPGQGVSAVIRGGWSVRELK
jgi:hypothetical protein